MRKITAVLLLVTLATGCGSPKESHSTQDPRAVMLMDEQSRRIAGLETLLAAERDRSKKLEEVSRLHWERILRIERTLGPALYRDTVPQETALPTSGNASQDRGSVSSSNALPSLPPRSKPLPTFAPPAPPRIESVKYRVTESNDSWNRVAWEVTISNVTGHTASVDLVVRFEDGSGFIIDDDKEYDIAIPPGRKTISGYDLVSNPAAQNLKRVSAVVTADD